MCHCSRLTSSGAAQLNALPQPQVTDLAACHAHISGLALVARCSCTSFETKVDLLSDQARPTAPLPNVARKAPSLAPARSIDSRRCAEVVMWLAPFVSDVLLFERLVPDRGVAAERAAEGDVERHRAVDLVGERVDLGVVHLMRVVL